MGNGKSLSSLHRLNDYTTTRFYVEFSSIDSRRPWALHDRKNNYSTTFYSNLKDAIYQCDVYNDAENDTDPQAIPTALRYRIERFARDYAVVDNMGICAPQRFLDLEGAESYAAAQEAKRSANKSPDATPLPSPKDCTCTVTAQDPNCPILRFPWEKRSGHIAWDPTIVVPQQGCRHKWARYMGLFECYDHCATCGAKKDKTAR